jgi:hypothetical protein
MNSSLFYAFLAAFACILLAAILCSFLILTRSSKLRPMDRIFASAIPTLTALLGIDAFLNIYRAPWYGWNGIRLSRTFAIYKGGNLYPGQNEMGAIIGTDHTPMSHFLYWPATFAPTPAMAIWIGATISFALVIAPLIWLFCIDKPAKLLYSFYALLACLFILLRGGHYSGMLYIPFSVHTDAAAICFSTLAGGLLFRSRSIAGWRTLLLSSLFAVLSVASKQTMAPVLLANCIFLLIANGVGSFRRYMACLAMSGAAVGSLLVLRFWPLKDFLFNVITLATHRPPVTSWTAAILEDLVDSTVESSPAIFCILVFILYSYVYERGTIRSWRELLSNQRWLIFPLSGILLAPVCIKAQILGGNNNHTGLYCYFFVLGATLGLKSFMNEEANLRRATGSRLLAATLIAMSFTGVVDTVQGNLTSLHHANSKSEDTIAYEYGLRHPGKTYFPDNPLAEYYTQHHFYDADSALLDREVTGYPVSQAQLAAGIPTGVTLVAFACSQPCLPSLAMQEYLKGWPPESDPELPGFTVFENPSVTLQIAR